MRQQRLDREVEEQIEVMQSISYGKEEARLREKKQILEKEEEARVRIEKNEAYDQAWLAKEEAKAEERDRLLQARLDDEKERERRAEERARDRDRAMELSLEQQEAFRVLRERKALDEYRARAKMALQAREGADDAIFKDADIHPDDERMLSDPTSDGREYLMTGVAVSSVEHDCGNGEFSDQNGILSLDEVRYVAQVVVLLTGGLGGPSPSVLRPRPSPSPSALALAVGPRRWPSPFALALTLLRPP